MNEWLKGRLKALVNFRGTPHQMGLAFGLGLALGIIPGTGAIAAAATATILRLNLPLMVAGALIANPFTTPFVYTGSYLLGAWLLGDWLPAGRVLKVTLGVITGNLILAAGLGLIGYLVVLLVVLKIRSRQAAIR